MDNSPVVRRGHRVSPYPPRTPGPNNSPRLAHESPAKSLIRRCLFDECLRSGRKSNLSFNASFSDEDDNESQPELDESRISGGNSFATFNEEESEDIMEGSQPADLSSEVSAALAAQELAVAREKLSTNRLQAVIQRQRLLETITAVRKAEVEYDMMEATVKRDEVLVGKWAALLHENGHSVTYHQHTPRYGIDDLPFPLYTPARNLKTRAVTGSSPASKATNMYSLSKTNIEEVSTLQVDATIEIDQAQNSVL